MYRPSFTPLMHHHHHPQQWQETCARLLAPLTIWICVSVSLKYGYYGDCRMVLGPSSSRLFEVSSVFVKQLQVGDYDKKEVLLYGFSEKPQLSLETNWSVSNYVIVGSYSRKGFYLWLNKGSRIRMKWEAEISSLGQVQVSLIKGERKYETLEPTSRSFFDAYVLNEPTEGNQSSFGKKSRVIGRAAEYVIEEDDRYYVGIINSNPRIIIMSMNVNVSSKMYDTTKAKTACSTLFGSCQLNLRFPNAQFVAVTTPNNGDIGGWYVELSYVARVVTYIVILGVVAILVFLILKYIRACDDNEGDREEEPVNREINENYPLIPEKTFSLPYGTDKEDAESGKSSSSEDLYDGKICVICYDETRNCFIVPCGHCATCYDCAQRIMNGESKVCPICRRLIHKVRKLTSP